MINIEYIGNGEDKGKVHIKEYKQTGCGHVFSDNPEDWRDTNKAVTCEKRGCSNK